MVKRVVGTLAIAALLVSVGLTGMAMADEELDVMVEPEIVGNTVCPVTGNAIEAPGEYTVEYDGKVYNVYSEECIETFKTDPVKYAALAEAEAAAVAASEAAEEAAMLEMREEADVATEATSTSSR